MSPDLLQHSLSLNHPVLLQIDSSLKCNICHIVNVDLTEVQ